jgi:hypothetical protein
MEGILADFCAWRANKYFVAPLRRQAPGLTLTTYGLTTHEFYRKRFGSSRVPRAIHNRCLWRPCGRNRPTKRGKEKSSSDGQCQLQKEMDDHLLALIFERVQRSDPPK